MHTDRPMPKHLEANPALVAGIGLLLLAGGVAAGMFVLVVVRQAFYEPHEIPLFQTVFGIGDLSTAFSITDDGGESVFQLSHVAVTLIIAAVMAGVLGSIIGAAITEGGRLLRAAYGLYSFDGSNQKKSN